MDGKAADLKRHPESCEPVDGSVVLSLTVGGCTVNWSSEEIPTDLEKCKIAIERVTSRSGTTAWS